MASARVKKCFIYYKYKQKLMLCTINNNNNNNNNNNKNNNDNNNDNNDTLHYYNMKMWVDSSLNKRRVTQKDYM